jgi:hypothetical protein
LGKNIKEWAAGNGGKTARKKYNFHNYVISFFTKCGVFMGKLH